MKNSARRFVQSVTGDGDTGEDRLQSLARRHEKKRKGELMLELLLELLLVLLLNLLLYVLIT